jgi:DNA-directed RNA polymerase specialized sigma24 family protein
LCSTPMASYLGNLWREPLHSQSIKRRRPIVQSVIANDHMKKQGESNVSRSRWLRQKASDRSEYVSKEEFVSVFDRERAGLQRLALLLTANSEAAERCLIRAFRECIASSAVSKEWVLNWTRRVVIRNAISLVMGPRGQSFVNTNDDADNGSMAFSPDESLDALAKAESIRSLPELDRFVFVICILEHYSIRDCALLLARSPREIDEVRHRVGNQVGQMDELSDTSRRFAIVSPACPQRRNI